MDLAERIENLPPVKRALLEKRLKQKLRTQHRLIAVSSDGLRDRFPLSFAQQRLWFLYQMDPQNSFYNISFAWRLNGQLNAGGLKKSLHLIIQRHTALRTTFTTHEGKPVQVVKQSVDSSLPVVDICDLLPAQQDIKIQQVVTEEAREPFDLEKGPLMRMRLVRLGDRDHILVLIVHHIVFDGWSMALFLRELSRLYKVLPAGQVDPLPVLPIQYTDFAVWQRNRMQGEVLDKQLAYWKAQLDGAPPLLELPSDRLRPAIQSFKGASHWLEFDLGVVNSLRVLSRQEGCTLFMTLLAIVQVMLQRYTRQNDIVVGTAVAGRRQQETEDLIGFFVNTLVLRTDLSGEPTFRQLLGRVRETALDAYDHQDLPFEKIVEELKPERSLSYSPLFQVMFVFQSASTETLRLEGLDIQPVEIDSGVEKFDLTLSASEAPDGLCIHWSYNTDIYDQDTIRRMIRHYRSLLQQAIAQPDKLISEYGLLSIEERQQLLFDWNATEMDYSRDQCIPQLFEAQVARTPKAVAVVYGDQQLNYAELDVRANRLANHLCAQGLGPANCVGILMERSPNLIVSFLGVLKAGAAYVPLDVSYPCERLTFMIDDSQASVVLTERRFRRRLDGFKGRVICLDDQQPAFSETSHVPPKVHGTSGDPAYVIYTSGSTGIPKGVCVPHRAVTRLVQQTNYIQIYPHDRIAQASSSSFDAATFEIWGALLNGACLVGMTRDELLKPSRFATRIREKGITIMFLTTALFNKIAAHDPSAFNSLDCLLFGGEAVDPRWVRAVVGQGGPEKLLHVYGPTENTTFSTWYPVTSVPRDATTIPIGKPLANTRCYVLDEHRQPVPIGVPGELYLGGDGLAIGYHNRASLSDERFIPDPFHNIPGNRLYCTGDLVRYTVEGEIEFLGRMDNQIKLRGFRIELGEIEAVLKLHRSVQDALVVLASPVDGENRIVAYCVTEGGETLDHMELRNFMRRKVPDYMVPSIFVFLQAFPLNQNGKVDRKALPDPESCSIKFQGEHSTPRNFLERQIARIWEMALTLKTVGIDDNFFDIGGHSLLAIQVLSEIHKVTGKNLPVATLFEKPTIRQLAQLIRKGSKVPEIKLLMPFQPCGSKPPFFCIHGAVAGLAEYLGMDQPFYGGMPHGYDGRLFPLTTEAIAADYIREIKMIYPEGPYFIGGYSYGGLVAFEMARQLQAGNEKVTLLVLFDPTIPGRKFRSKSYGGKNPGSQVAKESVREYLNRISQTFWAMNFREKRDYIGRKILQMTIKKTGMDKNWKKPIFVLFPKIGRRIPESMRKQHRNTIFKKAAQSYPPRVYAGNTLLFLLEQNSSVSLPIWRSMLEDELEIQEIPGCHLELFEKPQIEILAEKLRNRLQREQLSCST